MKKNMKYLFLLITTFLTAAAFAQIKPDFFPEDVSPENIETRCYCKPGVLNKSRSRGLEVAYSMRGGGEFTPEDFQPNGPPSTFDHLRRFEFDLKLPVIRTETFKLLLGYKYYSESYKLKSIGTDFGETFMELDRQHLKSSSLSVIASKPLNEKSYLAFRFRYSANGDYNGLIKFEKQYAVYKWLGSGAASTLTWMGI